jgi:hypothetical protein
MHERGATKKNRRTPRPFAKSQTHPAAIRFFFLVRLWALLGKGSSKTPWQYFCKKSMSKTIPKNRQKFRCQFFFDFFCFIAVSGVSQRWEFKNTTKKIQNKSCPKVFTKYSTKNPKPTFSRLCFITFLGVSPKQIGRPLEGVEKHHKNISKKQILPLSFYDL